jgi:hypothetical protein
LAVVTIPTNNCNALSFCSSYGAFVTCLVKVYQGAGACFSIQIYDASKLAADLSIFDDIQVLIKDVGNNIVAIASDPVLIGSSLDVPLERTEDGKINFCISSENTKLALTGKLTCDIKMTIPNSSGNPDIIFITCLQLGVVYSTSFDMSFTVPPDPVIPPEPADYHGTSGNIITIPT